MTRPPGSTAQARLPPHLGRRFVTPPTPRIASLLDLEPPGGLEDVAGGRLTVPADAGRLASRSVRGAGTTSLVSSSPVCPTCGQPASQALAGFEHDWECRNEACPEFGQPVQADEPAPREDTDPDD
jgi:hypothetical protein